MAGNLNRVQFNHTIIDQYSPQCEGCGEQIRYNANAAGRESSKEPGKLLNGWSHQDGMLRDHEATPPFGTSGESELTRTRAGIDQARMRVRETLQKNFAELELGQQVDSVFKDRR